MSYRDFTEALEKAPNCKYYTTTGGMSADKIEEAEKLLGIRFSRQNREFYERLGYLSFFGCEIFSIDAADLGMSEGNSIAYALMERAQYGLPKECLPIIDLDDDCLGCLDYGNLNEEGEPPVTEMVFNGSYYRRGEIIAEDFGQFLLMLVNYQLAEQ